MAFGLGFDTASEVGLMVPAVQSLPTLFAAGITHIEIIDGVLMSKAYDWALPNPIKKRFSNVTTTGPAVGRTSPTKFVSP